MRAVILVVLLACGSNNGDGKMPPTSSGDGKRSDVPPAISAITHKGEEVRAFTGWSAPGTTLYEIRELGDDASDVTVVGVDRSGTLVAGANLMRKLGTLPADELARRALAVLLRRSGREPLTPASPRPSSVTDQEWTVVAPPAIADGTLVFFATVGEKQPELVEYRVVLATFAVTQRHAAELLLASGEPVKVTEDCEPLVDCGCWRGCVRFQKLRIPDPPNVVWRKIGMATPDYVRCTGADCVKWCSVDSPTPNPSQCFAALRPIKGEACDKTCPSTDAKYHCATYADRCDQVAHKN